MKITKKEVLNRIVDIKNLLIFKVWFGEVVQMFNDKNESNDKMDVEFEARAAMTDLFYCGLICFPAKWTTFPQKWLQTQLKNFSNVIKPLINKIDWKTPKSKNKKNQLSKSEFIKYYKMYLMGFINASGDKEHPLYNEFKNNKINSEKKQKILKSYLKLLESYKKDKIPLWPECREIKKIINSLISPNSKDLKEAAEQGDAEAQYNLAVCYWRGENVKKDLKKAAFWFNKAAAQNNPNAQFALGCCYIDGELNIKINPAKAAYWFEKAAKLGSPEAENSLGTLYQNGQGVKKDLKKAALWFEKAAIKNEQFGQLNLGFCYLNGQGVKKDLKKAAFWFNKAAMQGDDKAQYNLAVCYLNGHGVKKDLKKAMLWLEQSAKQNNKYAKKALINLNKQS